jgi:hypothetical protein
MYCNFSHSIHHNEDKNSYQDGNSLTGMGQPLVLIVGMMLLWSFILWQWIHAVHSNQENTQTKLMPRSHQTFCPVPIVKLLGITLRNKCWPINFHTNTVGDADGWCRNWPVWLVPHSQPTHTYWYEPPSNGSCEQRATSGPIWPVTPWPHRSGQTQLAVVENWGCNWPGYTSVAPGHLVG